MSHSRKLRRQSKVKFILPLLGAGLLVLALSMYVYVLNPAVICGRSAGSDLLGSSPPMASDIGPDELAIPRLSDWVDYGPVLEAGPEGAWDFQWGGATPVSVLKKDGTYYFYYVASDGYRSFDGGPRHRAIGVATSQDGIRFAKYEGNPVMTHAPFNGEEEGANSAGISLDSNGHFVMYYGAARGRKDKITSDGRLAVSSTGFDFEDVTKVLDHLDPCVHGHGDEIFPVATFLHNGNWYVYYSPNGGTAPGTLGMAWGPTRDRLSNSLQVLDGSSGGWPVGIWGNVAWLSPHKIALFIQRLRWPETFVEVRIASPDAPHRLSEPVERYDIPNLKRGTVFLDTERRTWFMYYNDFDRFWDVKLAPAGDPDTTPPSRPENLTAAALSYEEVNLTWDAANDPDTGVVIYNVYRNGVKIASTKGLTHTDTGLAELSEYTYAVAAVNFHGAEGTVSEATVATPADNSLPIVTSAAASADPTQVTVVFGKAVDEASATRLENYRISNGITVTGASLNTDQRTVVLKTSGHRDNMLYELTVNRVFDRSVPPNRVPCNAQTIYTYSAVPGMVGYWSLDQASGAVAADVSGFGNDGLVNGATWQDGVVNGALRFDGIDDHVLIPNLPPLEDVTNGSFTFAAWTKPDTVPPTEKAYGIFVRAHWYPAISFGLFYTSERKYQAQLITMPNESHVAVKSSPVQPGSWRHVTMVVDDVAKQLFLYVDGEPVGASPEGYSDRLLDLDEPVGENYPAGEYFIGSNKPDGGTGSFFTSHFKGMLDDVRVYNRALSAAEVQTLSQLSKMTMQQ